MKPDYSDSQAYKNPEQWSSLGYANIRILTNDEDSSSEIVVTFGEDDYGPIAFDKNDTAHKIASIMVALWDGFLKRAEAEAELFEGAGDGTKH